MLDDNKHIDSLFADGLKGLAVEPNPEVWNEISGKMLAAQRRRRGVIMYISAALAASILLFFGIANRNLFTSEPGNLQLEQLSENIVANNTTNQNRENANTENESLSNTITSGNAVKNYIVQAKPENNNTNQLFAKLVSDSREEFTKESLVNAKVLVWNRLPNSGNEIPTQLHFHQPDKVDTVVLSVDELIVQNNLLAMKQTAKEKLKEERWSVIGQLSSVYSNEKSAESVSNGIVSFGGGVKVNYALGEKLALQTGFMYNSFGQDLSGRNNQFAFTSDVSLTEGENSMKILPSRTAAGDIKYAGVIMNAIPEYMVASPDATSEYMVASAYASSEDLMQSFETIEIPFILRYNLSQKRVSVFISGGFGANWIVNNGVYNTSGSKQKIGEIDNLRTTNFSSQLGFGFEYRLNSKLQIGLEPSFKYYLNSINKSSQFDYKPYSIGLFTGIRYNF